VLDIFQCGRGFFFDKNREPIISAGSNFDIMNPVCGVNLTEDKKMKSGEKIFFINIINIQYKYLKKH
jgi:hypothetical protein